MTPEEERTGIVGAGISLFERVAEDDAEEDETPFAATPDAPVGELLPVLLLPSFRWRDVAGITRVAFVCCEVVALVGVGWADAVGGGEGVEASPLSPIGEGGIEPGVTAAEVEGEETEDDGGEVDDNETVNDDVRLGADDGGGRVVGIGREGSASEEAVGVGCDIREDETDTKCMSYLNIRRVCCSDLFGVGCVFV